MKTHPSWFWVLAAGLCLLLLGAPSAAAPAPAAENERSEPAALAGLLVAVRSDPGRAADQAPGTAYVLFDDSGQAIRLEISESLVQARGGSLALDRRRVVVEGEWRPGRAVLAVRSVQLDRSAAGGGGGLDDVTGPQPWVSVLCKFSDVPDEPQPLDYFQNMYGSSYPALDHYWREQSYDLANVLGSQARGWYTLPQPRSYYVYDNDGDGELELDWGRAADDCTAVADPDIYYPDFVGINLMFNDTLDCCAWGGGWYMTLDGVNRLWYMTWEPPWGYGNIGVIEHEMGHGFGLPHSSGDYGQTYDNQWDVMSDVWSNCIPDPVYACLGQGTISYHKDILGWVAPERKLTISPGTHASLTLEQLALPPDGNYLLARIPIAESTTHFYTVEARRHSGYDVKLPGQAVIIHDVETTRDRPAHVIDIDGNGNTGDAGAQWLPGETFIDAAAGITVSVKLATPTGFVIDVDTRIVPMAGLELDGVGGCTVGTPCPLAAAVTPVTATVPITYLWEATGQPPVIHRAGVADAITYTWDVTGTQLVTVTATNGRQTLAAPAHRLITDICLARVAGQPGMEYGSVQEAVDAAAEGDTVQVAGYCSGAVERDGLWQVVHVGKAIVVRGGYYPPDWTAPDPLAHPTTLDAHGRGRAAYLTGSGQPTLESLALTGGDAAGLGGGRYGRDAGGGLYVDGATAVISGCQIVDNVAVEGAGAYVLTSVQAGFYRNTVTGGTAQSGGGLFFDHSTGLLDGNLVTANAALSGGGAYLWYSPVTLGGNRVEGNAASTYGGGLLLSYSQATLKNNVVAGNHTDYFGSGLYLDHSSPQLFHTTIARNLGGDGSGLYATNSSSVAMVDSIATGQTIGVAVKPTSSANLNGVLWFDNGTNSGGGGSITILNPHAGDPLFAEDGYHVQPGSAAMDAGIDSGVTTDIDGDGRPQCDAYDLGADELVPDAPLAAFASTTPDWLGQTTAFDNTSAAMCAGYAWDFGDGTASPAISPTHAYALPGLYTVVLTATNSAGSSTATGEVVIYGAPLAGFTAWPTHGLLPLTVAFTSTAATVPPGDPTLTFEWQFGDGITASVPSPTHTYTATGLYTVTLEVSNAAGTATVVAPRYIAVGAYAVYLPVVMRH